MGHRSAKQDNARRKAGPPPLALLALEAQRAVLEGLALVPSTPLLRSAPRGDGHAVLVLPGFITGDLSTRALRNYLRRQGYYAHAWKLGPNLGYQAGMRARIAARVDELYERSGQPISLVGWSLGGIYAREIAKARPEVVRQVITLGSPFGDAGRATNLTLLFDLLSTASAATDRGKRSALVAQLRCSPTCPSTAIYSRSDGVADWRACREPEAPNTDNIEVVGSHCGLVINPMVLYAIADRLSQPEGDWQPFERVGWRAHVYR